MNNTRGIGCFICIVVNEYLYNVCEQSSNKHMYKTNILTIWFLEIHLHNMNKNSLNVKEHRVSEERDTTTLEVRPRLFV